MQHVAIRRSFLSLVFLLIFISVNGLSFAADEPPILDIPTLSVSYLVGDDPVTVAPDLIINPVGTPNLDGTRVLIGTNFSAGDELIINNAINGTVGTIAYTYSAMTGVMELNGAGTTAEYQAALRLVQYRNTSGTPSLNTRTVNFSLGKQLANPDNGHFYEFVTSNGIDWSSANTAAKASDFFGLQGYLTTITSASENAFVASKLAGQGWMGASDDAAVTLDANGEGYWYWVSGPEAGTLFCISSGAGNCAPQASSYVNWAADEPNNCCAGENYGHFYVGGQWNDYAFDNESIEGYVVEYGGSAGDPTLQITDSVEVTLTVPPNDAPILSPIGARTADIDSPFTFTATATDPNNDALTFSLGDGAPAGTAIDPNTGVFTWTPDTYGVFTVTVVVSDDAYPALSDQEEVSIRVGQELVTNGGFEQFTSNLPDDWNPVKIVPGQMKVKCNATANNCFLQLKASPSKPRTKITQIADPAQVDLLQTGDELVLSARVRSNRSVAKVIRVKIFYDNPALGTGGFDLLYLRLPKTDGFKSLSTDPLVLKGTVSMIKVRVRYPASAGKYALDDISVLLTPVGSTLGSAIPLPVASGEFKK